jgi:cytochrome c5
MDNQAARFISRLALAALAAGVTALSVGCGAAAGADEEVEAQTTEARPAEEARIQGPLPERGKAPVEKVVIPTHGTGSVGAPSPGKQGTGQPAQPNDPSQLTTEPQPSPWMEVPTIKGVQDTPVNEP